MASATHRAHRGRGGEIGHGSIIALWHAGGPPLAPESYADDVVAVAGELAQAVDVPAFIAALRELVELASAGRVVVADDGDALVVRSQAGKFSLAVEHPGGHADAEQSSDAG